MVYPLSTMIRDAVVHIRQQKGTSLVEIQKHLEANCNNKLDRINKKMLTSALNGLIQRGQLQKIGSNYKLALNSKSKIPIVDVPSRRHNHCTRPTRYRQGYRKPNPTGHRHCPRKRRRRRRHHRRRHIRHHRGHHKIVHHHCSYPTRTKRGYRPPNRRGHRHCPRR